MGPHPARSLSLEAARIFNYLCHIAQKGLHCLSRWHGVNAEMLEIQRAYVANIYAWQQLTTGQRGGWRWQCRHRAGHVTNVATSATTLVRNRPELNGDGIEN